MDWYCSKVGLEEWEGKLADCCIAQLSVLATLPHFDRKEPSVVALGVVVTGGGGEDWR